MVEHVLTELQYSMDREGPWKLYVFGTDGYHSGGKWFRLGRPLRMDKEITARAALTAIETAMADPAIVEVRVCDGGDELVFRSYGKAILFGDGFLQFIKERLERE